MQKISLLVLVSVSLARRRERTWRDDTSTLRVRL